MNSEALDAKLQEYEKYIEDKLKVDLKEVEEKLKAKHKDHSDWLELKNIISYLRRFKEMDIDTNLQLPLGCGVHVNGEIVEYDTLLVDVGCDCLLEMDYEEADKYANIRLNMLKKEIEHYRKLAVNIKVHIKFVLLAINELQSMNIKPRNKTR